MTVIAVLYVIHATKQCKFNSIFGFRTCTTFGNGTDWENFPHKIYFSLTVCFTTPLYLLVDNGSSLGMVRRPTGGDIFQTKEGKWGFKSPKLGTSGLTSRYTPSNFILIRHFPGRLLTASSIHVDQSQDPRGISRVRCACTMDHALPSLCSRRTRARRWR
jgi:hypothetical protein